MPDQLSDLGLVDPFTGAPADTQQAPQSDTGWEYTTLPDHPDGRLDSGWDSDQNPYKKKAEQLEQRFQQSQPPIAHQLEARKQQWRVMADEAYNYARQQGLSDEVAKSLIAPQLEARLSQEELHATRAATLPLVTKEFVTNLAKEVSNPKAGVVVNPDELEGLGSVEAMRARAKALADERQNRGFDTRRATGVDRAEGRAPVTGKSRFPEDLPSTERIKRGLEIGHG